MTALLTPALLTKAEAVKAYGRRVDCHGGATYIETSATDHETDCLDVAKAQHERGRGHHSGHA